MGANCSQYCMNDEKKLEFDTNDVQGYTSNGQHGNEYSSTKIMETPFDKSTSTEDIVIDDLPIKSFDELNW